MRTGLVAAVDLLPGVLSDLLGEHRRVERAAGLDLAGGREVDLLGHQLVVDHPAHEAAAPVQNARTSSTRITWRVTTRHRSSLVTCRPPCSLLLLRGAPAEHVPPPVRRRRGWRPG